MRIVSGRAFAGWQLNGKASTSNEAVLFYGDKAQVVPASTLNDPEIRHALRAYLSRDLAAADGRVLEELGLCRGQVRADVVVVKNEQLHAYEIKFDRDTLGRLARQADAYGLTMDRVTLVVGTRRLDEALRIVPSWWGVLRVSSGPEGLRLSALRKGRRNAHRDRRALVELLWHSDALRFLEERGASRGVKGKPRRVVWDRICDRFDLDEIASAVREQLIGRAMLECSRQCA